MTDMLDEELGLGLIRLTRPVLYVNGIGGGGSRHLVLMRACGSGKGMAATMLTPHVCRALLLPGCSRRSPRGQKNKYAPLTVLRPTLKNLFSQSDPMPNRHLLPVGILKATVSKSATDLQFLFVHLLQLKTR